MVLLGNKTDCEEERQVPSEAGRKLAQVSTWTSLPLGRWKTRLPGPSCLPVAEVWLAQIWLYLITQPLQLGHGLKPRLCPAGTTLNAVWN